MHVYSVWLIQCFPAHLKSSPRTILSCLVQSLCRYYNVSWFSIICLKFVQNISKCNVTQLLKSSKLINKFLAPQPQDVPVTWDNAVITYCAKCFYSIALTLISLTLHLCFLTLQILMNVKIKLTIVIIMLIVQIQMDLSTVPASLDILEMAHHVKVSVYLKLQSCCFVPRRFLFHLRI